MFEFHALHQATAMSNHKAEPHEETQNGEINKATSIGNPDEKIRQASTK